MPLDVLQWLLIRSGAPAALLDRCRYGHVPGTFAEDPEVEEVAAAIQELRDKNAGAS